MRYNHCMHNANERGTFAFVLVVELKLQLCLLGCVHLLLLLLLLLSFLTKISIAQKRKQHEMVATSCRARDMNKWKPTYCRGAMVVWWTLLETKKRHKHALGNVHMQQECLVPFIIKGFLCF